MGYNHHMRKERTLLIIGCWIIILPFLGFPNNWRENILIISGLSLVYLAYLFYIEKKATAPKNENRSRTFVDNIGSGE
jgi:hypothetical protein